MTPELSRHIDELVTANHILFHEGVVDGFGHVSMRHPEAADRFLIARSMAPALVTAADVVELDFDAAPRAGETRRLYLERFIHAEIYRQRPDVGAVVHSHSQTLVQFGIVKNVRLQPVCHMCGFLGTGVPVFEIRDTAGSATDLLVRDPALGRALAASLGASTAVLMRGHGSTVVGDDVRQAVFRAVYLEKNAQIQAEALKLGEITALTPEEAAAADATNSAQIGRSWDLWKQALTGV